MFSVSSGWNLPPGLPSVSTQLHVQPHQNNQDQHAGYHQHVRSVFVCVRVCVCECMCICVCVRVYVSLVLFDSLCVHSKSPSYIHWYTYIHTPYLQRWEGSKNSLFLYGLTWWQVFVRYIHKMYWIFSMDRVNTLVTELISAQKASHKHNKDLSHL